MSETISRDPANVLSGLLTRPELSKQLGCVERTVIRYERTGMPFIKFGGNIYDEPAKVRDWILSHEMRPKAPRRGRPRKAA